jgi:hypothetical protein
MSMDLFLTCARDGKGSTFKRALLEEIMGRGAIDPKYPLTRVRYADGASEIDAGEGEDIETVSFLHFGGETFFDRLWELADRTSSYFVWPDEERSLAVTRPDMIAKIDPHTIESLGPAYIVRSGKELGDAILDGIDPEGSSAGD